jgi:N-acetylneuraminate synthase
VKFQTHIAAAESTPGEPWRIKFSKQDDTRYEYWQRMEFPVEHWRGLAEHATDRGILFLSSAFSNAAVDLLEGLDMPAWKVGSGELTNLPMLDRMAATGRPILLSGGMSTWEEMDAAVARVRDGGGSVAVFQCSSYYPCPPEKVGFNVIGQLRERYGCPVGLSDHSGSIWAGVAGAALGIDMLEIHAVFHRTCFGPDTPSSVTVDELADLVRGVRFVETARRNPVDKDAAAAELATMKRTFQKSVVAAEDLKAGTVLSEAHFAFKKPGTGMPASRAAELVRKTLRVDIARDEQFVEGRHV